MPHFRLTMLLCLHLSSFLIPPAASFPALPIQQEDYSWNQCVPTKPGSCTMYISTSDPDVDDYRIWVIFDNNCSVMRAIKGSRYTPVVKMAAKAGSYVEMHLDSLTTPRGWMWYSGNDYDMGDTMTCNKPPLSDGVGCRKEFVCDKYINVG